MSTFKRKRRALGQNPAIRATRRKELIEAAIHVIAQHGYAGCTVGKVAKRAGASQGLMNFHFKSIDLLLEAAFNHLADEFDQAWKARVAEAGPEPWDRITAMVDAYFGAEVFTAEKLAVWFTFWVDSGLRDRFRSAAVRVERRYHRDLEAEMLRIVPSKKEAAALIGMLSALVDGYWLQALLYPKTFKSRHAVQSCLTWLRQAVENAPKPGRNA
ncbi:transcriptional regulator BetI [Dongia sp.]|uniref:transcriptional regulator BetI n=1 Tax=Dongia sp. TaxID=1977262 RepID=UPI0037528BDD